MRRSSYKITGIYTLLGMLFGYLILHPFVNVADLLLHIGHGRGVEMSWLSIVAAFTGSFTFRHLPHAGAFVLLSGLIGYVLGRIHDSYRKIEEQTKRLSLIGMNASSIIHDLSNPLEGLILATYSLKERTKEPDMLARCQVIERGISRLLRMVRDIKVTSQAAEFLTLEKSAVKLGPFLEEVISGMNLHSPVEFSITYDGEVSLDREYFERVVWNLLKNADEALVGGAGGKIQVSVAEHNDLVTISILDNGPGVAPDILKDPFRFGHSFGKKGGSGIGLYNCKKIIEAHGGEIWLESESGKGAKAFIQIAKNK